MMSTIAMELRAESGLAQNQVFYKQNPSRELF